MEQIGHALLSDLIVCPVGQIAQDSEPRLDFCGVELPMDQGSE